MSLLELRSILDLKWFVPIGIPLMLCFLSNFVAYFIEPKELSLTEQTINVSEWITDPMTIIRRIENQFAVVPDHVVLQVGTFFGGNRFWAGIRRGLPSRCSSVAKTVF